ncbi:MAG: YggS family pyridoxal phosphate-dependent enzyme [Caldimonas sp.]|nr:YggS family pyridoxal phosphate-dependent enzyme [Pseudomonadota bacterium]
MIADNLARVNERIASACARAGRPVQSVTLLVVSKTHAAAAVREAFDAGARHFGENYVQEGLEKIERLGELRSGVEWHLIGPLQSNKTRVVAERFDWVHSVDRVRTAERLSAQRPPELLPLSVCLQVNISGEASKAGLDPAAVPAAANAIAALPGLALRGLMAIPEPAADLEAQRRPHRALRLLLESLRTGGLALDTLSMGMSDDLEAAIAEGATIVRVGRAIFGERPG